MRHIPGFNTIIMYDISEYSFFCFEKLCVAEQKRRLEFFCEDDGGETSLAIQDKKKNEKKKSSDEISSLGSKCPSNGEMNH